MPDAVPPTAEPLGAGVEDVAEAEALPTEPLAPPAEPLGNAAPFDDGLIVESGWEAPMDPPVPTAVEPAPPVGTVAHPTRPSETATAAVASFFSAGELLRHQDRNCKY